jgi:hypothetical protein
MTCETGMPVVAGLGLAADWIGTCSGPFRPEALALSLLLLAAADAGVAAATGLLLPAIGASLVAPVVGGQLFGPVGIGLEIVGPEIVGREIVGPEIVGREIEPITFAFASA